MNGQVEACTCSNKSCELYGKPIDHRVGIPCSINKCTACGQTLTSMADIGSRNRLEKKLYRKIRKYLDNESIFPIDSPHTGKKLPEDVYMSEQERKSPERILIDFDRTIHKYSKGWLDGSIYDKPIDGIKEAINELRQKYEIVIFTARVSQEENKDWKEQSLAIKEWMKHYGIYFDRITAEKLAAKFYIDDRAIRFEGNWSTTLQVIRQLESVISLEAVRKKIRSAKL